MEYSSPKIKRILIFWEMKSPKKNAFISGENFLDSKNKNIPLLNFLATSLKRILKF